MILSRAYFGTIGACLAMSLAGACAGGMPQGASTATETGETERTRPTALAREDRRTLPGTECTLDFATRRAFLADAQLGRAGNMAGVARFFPLAQYSEPGAERFDWSAATLLLPARTNESKEQRLVRALDAWAKETGLHVEQPSVEIVSEDARIWTFARDASWTAKLRLELHGPYVLAIDSQYGPSGEAASTRFVGSLQCEPQSLSLPTFTTETVRELGLDLELPNGTAESIERPAVRATPSVAPYFSIADVGPSGWARRVRVGGVMFDAEAYAVALAADADIDAFIGDMIRARRPNARVERSCGALGRATLHASEDTDSAHWLASAIVSRGHVAILSATFAADAMSSETWLSVQHFLAQAQATEIDATHDANDAPTMAVLDRATVEPALRAQRAAINQCFARERDASLGYALIINRAGDVATVTDGSDGARSQSVDACMAPALRGARFTPGYTARIAYLACSRAGCVPASAYQHDASHALAACPAPHANEN